MKTASKTQGKQVIHGLVYVLGDNIDTDLIIPAQYLNLVPTIPDEYRQLGSYAMAGLPDTYSRFVKQGEFKSDFVIIIAGKNFGCGSSREHAPIALGAAGIKAVLAESYARIFFRNAVATGELYPLEAEERLCDIFKTGDKVELNLKSTQVANLTTGKVFSFKSPGAVAPVIQAGGLFGYARKTGMIKQKSEPRSQRAGEGKKKTGKKGGKKSTR